MMYTFFMQTEKTDAQADLSLRWEHMSDGTFSRFKAIFPQLSMII